MAGAPLCYQFGEWLIESDLNQGRCKEQKRHLQPRAMEVLLCLLERPGKLVSTAELLERVWTGRVVEESAVQQRISMIRRFLGDDTRNPTYIQNIPKKGYLAIAPVIRSDMNNAAVVLQVTKLFLTTSAPSITVLPFTSKGNEEDQQCISDGLSEDIITELSHIPGLLVVDRHSSFLYRDKVIASGRLDGELGVN